VFGFSQQIANYIGGAYYIVWLIPMGILTTGMLQACNAYGSRNQIYSTISGARASAAISTVSTQSAGRAWFDYDSLIVGKLTGDMIFISLLLRRFLRAKALARSNISIKQVVENARRYERFPRYQTATSFINAVSQSLPIFVLGIYFSPEVAGFYALSVRVLKAPTNLIGASTKQVYYQTAANKFAKGEEILTIYVKTTIGLAKLIILPLLAVVFFGEFLFESVFGEEWAASGQLGQILILWFGVGFINTPSIVTYSILGLQKIQLQVELISLVLRAGAIYFGYYMFDSYVASISAFTAVSVATNLFLIVYIYKQLQTRAALL